MIYSKIVGLQWGPTAPPPLPTPQLQNLHHKVMPKLNSCIILWLALFQFNFLKVYCFLHLEITLTFTKLCYTFEEKLFFSATLIL